MRCDGRTDLDVVGHAVVAVAGAVDRGVLALVGAAEAVRSTCQRYPQICPKYAKIWPKFPKFQSRFRTLEVHLREVDVDMGAVRCVQPHAAVEVVRVTIMARVGVAAVS